MPWITPFGAHHGPSGPRGQREKVIGPLLAVCKSVATRHLGFSAKQGSHRLSVPYPPSAGLCICLLSSAGIVSRRHFAARKSGGSCDVAPERTAAAASGLVGLVGASFGGTRTEIQSRTAKLALNRLRLALLRAL